MDGENSQYIAEIKAAIQSGALTRSEMYGRLMRAVETEISKTDGTADMKFVAAAQDLIRVICGGKEEDDQLKMEQALQATRAKLEAMQKRRRRNRVIGRTIIATAAVIVFAVVGEGVLRRQWLSGQPTEDEQQYVITGHEIDPKLIQKGNAANGTIEPVEITTTDLSEAISVLGFTPPMPTWFPDGWVIEDYYASVNPANITFSIFLTNGGIELIKYDLTRYNEIGNALNSFEQNAKGTEIPLEQWNIYITENIERRVALWREDNTAYSLHGPLSEDLILKIIKSINEENST